MDHTGYDSGHMRGTSAKSDWAYVCLGITSERKRGDKNMRIQVKFDKARGLRPDETEPFTAQYDFKGNWTLGSSNKELDREEQKNELRKLLPKNLTQKAMAKELGCSDGTVNKLIKEINEPEPLFSKEKGNELRKICGLNPK